MAEFDLDKMASKMAEKALDEFTYNGKTLREWIEIIVAHDLLAIEELEKIKAEINAKERVELSTKEMWYNFALADVTYIIDKHISELKGENK